MKIKNIVIINDFAYTQGGATKISIETANVLAENPNYNVYFFTGDDSKNELSEKVKVISTKQGESLKERNKIKGIINNLYNFKAKRILNTLLKNLDSNETIIHVHGWTKCLSSSIFSILFKKKYKVILTLHDYFTSCPNGGFYNYKENKICEKIPMSKDCKKCDCDSRNKYFKKFRVMRQFIQNDVIKLTQKIKYVITISELSENISRKFLNKDVKAFRIYNPIDLNPIKERNILTEKSKYLFIGRLEKEKGIEEFCKSVTELNLESIVIGDGKEKEMLSNKYKNINFVGWKSRDEIIKYLGEAKALIFSSQWYETAGLTILEALSQGVCCFVKDTCAGREFIKEGKNGFLYKDYEDLIKKISENKNMESIEMIDFNKYSNEEYLLKIENAYSYMIGDVKNEI